MDLSQLYNDPAQQMRARMMGMNMEDYVAQMDPRAVEANLANIARRNSSPPVVRTQAEVDKMRSVGANSGANAFVENSPTTEGMLSSPNMSPPPQVDTSPQIAPSPDGGILQATPTMPEAPQDDISLKQRRMGTVGFQNPVLYAGGQGATSGSLTNGGVATPRPNAGPASGARGTPTNNTSNARRSGMPDMRIGRSEGLGRIGAAMMRGSKTGLLDSLSAGGDAMYANNDANRAAELGEYENSERLRLEKVKEAQVAAALAARGGGSGSGDGPNLAAAAAIKLRDVDTALQGLDDYDGVVGLGYWFHTAWDKLTDSQRATVRQKIARVKVDATLSNTAFTKGAISDKEMAIFQSDQPAWTDGEGQWRTWLTEYRNALIVMNTNLSTNASPYFEINNSRGAAASPPAAFNPAEYTIEEM